MEKKLNQYTKAELIKAVEQRGKALENIYEMYKDLQENLLTEKNKARNLEVKINFFKEMFNELLSAEHILVDGATETELVTKYSKRAALFKRVLDDK